MATNCASQPSRPVCRFVDKVAIVTGSSSGLGSEVALRLAREGACVTLTGRDEKRLMDMKLRCHNEAQAADKDGGGSKRKASERVISIVGDVTKADVRKKIVEETVQAFGRLDILVCNAGAYSPHRMAWPRPRKISLTRYVLLLLLLSLYQVRWLMFCCCSCCRF